MSKTKKVLNLSPGEVEEIEKTCQVSDPGDLVIDYLQLKIEELKELTREYKELENAPEKIKILGRKRIALLAEELGVALSAPTRQKGQ